MFIFQALCSRNVLHANSMSHPLFPPALAPTCHWRFWQTGLTLAALLLGRTFVQSSTAEAGNDFVTGLDGVHEDNFEDLDDGHFPSIDIDIDSNINPIKLNNFTFMHYNVWSIMAENRVEYLTNICRKYSIDVLAISESKLDDTIPSDLILIPRYHEPIQRDRNRNGGGCATYIANHKW